MSAILMYHSIAREPVNPYLQVAPSSLAQHLAIIREHGHAIVPLGAMLAGADGVAVTFDDGYADVLEAKPVLEDFGVTPTLFICPEHTGKRNSWAHSFSAELLTIAQLRALRDDGWDVQCHAWEHAPLARLPVRDLDAQFARCRAWFRAQLGIDATVLAYPYGDADAVVAGIAARHFEFGLAVDAIADITDARFNIPRISCVDAMSRAWLAGQLAARNVGGLR